MSVKFDEESQAAYDWRMLIESRLERIENDIAAMKLDIAILKATSATKTDIAELKAAIAESKSSTIMWVVTAVFVAQLLPALLKLFHLG